MPYINGVELIKKAKLELPLVQSIIISGFDSFDYAKQAISLGVVAYISKPITFEELTDSLNKAIVELDKKNSVDLNADNIKKNADNALKMVQNNDLTLLVTLKNISKEFKEKLDTDGINLNYKFIELGVFDYDNDAEELTFRETEVVDFLILNQFFNEINKGDLKSYIVPTNSTFIIFLLSNDTIDKQIIQDSFAQILAKIKKICNISMSIGLSESASLNDNTSFRELYRHAIRALEYRTVVGSNIVLFFEDVNKEKKATGKIDDNEFKQISYELLYGEVKTAKDKINKLLNPLQVELLKILITLF